MNNRSPPRTSPNFSAEVISLHPQRTGDFPHSFPDAGSASRRIVRLQRRAGSSHSRPSYRAPQMSRVRPNQRMLRTVFMAASRPKSDVRGFSARYAKPPFVAGRANARRLAVSRHSLLPRTTEADKLKADIQLTLVLVLSGSYTKH